MKIPGFTAAKLLSGSETRYVNCCESARMQPGSMSSLEQGAVIAAAENEPGGPGNVPSGYGRDCRLVPFIVCAGNRCWTEYGWVCTYYPLPRAQ